MKCFSHHFRVLLNDSGFYQKWKNLWSKFIFRNLPYVRMHEWRWFHYRFEDVCEFKCFVCYWYYKSKRSCKVKSVQFNHLEWTDKANWSLRFKQQLLLRAKNMSYWVTRWVNKIKIRNIKIVHPRNPEQKFKN